MIVVLGVGNLIRTDDGVGVQALQRLQDDPRVPRDLEIAFVDGSTRGIDLDQRHRRGHPRARARRH